MFSWIRKRSSQREVAHDIYGSIVAQARQPALYRDFGVPDDVTGRYEMICLHLFPVLERLGALGLSDSVGRDLVERFFTDMDDGMREMGVGDTAVPKKMRTASEGLYGRLDAYAKGARSDNPADLATAISRNVHGDAPDSTVDPRGPNMLARYVHASLNSLTSQPDADIQAGRIAFPDLSETAKHHVDA